MVAKLLRHSLGAAWAAERADGRGDGPPDLTDVRFIGALQRRYEEGVGLAGADAEVMHRWPHCVPAVHPTRETEFSSARMRTPVAQICAAEIFIVEQPLLTFGIVHASSFSLNHVSRIFLVHGGASGCSAGRGFGRLVI
jgi:hypothetical protein